jgi:hypothetical protein
LHHKLELAQRLLALLAADQMTIDSIPFGLD